MIELGVKCKDRVSGWEGTATARIEYLNGCIRYQIDGHDKDGKPEGYVFDEQQIELVDAPKLKTKAKKTGGPRTSERVTSNARLTR